MANPESSYSPVPTCHECEHSNPSVGTENPPCIIVQNAVAFIIYLEDQLSPDRVKRPENCQNPELFEKNKKILFFTPDSTK